MRAYLVLASLLIVVGCDGSNPSGTGGGGNGGSGGCGWEQCSCGQVYCGSCDACDQECDADNACPDKYYCDFPDGACGQILKGKCTILPIECGHGGHARACGCDGKVTTADCVLFSGQDIASDPNLCSDGTFACGALMCKNYVEYCEETLPGIPGADPSYACKQPAACENGVADCLCLKGITQGTCAEDANKQVTVTIALP